MARHSCAPSINPRDWGIIGEIRELENLPTPCAGIGTLPLLVKNPAITFY